MRLIDADALLDGIYSDNPKDVMLYIARFPTVEPRKGKWNKYYFDHIAMGERPTTFYCSSCGCCTQFRTDFCPNCGAEMRGEQEYNGQNRINT